MALRGLVQGLRNTGSEVQVIAPRRAAPAFLTFRRFLFNWGTDARSVEGADLVVGLDMDGYRLAPRVPRIVQYVLGVLGDEALYEKGLARYALKLQAAREQRLYLQASRVLTTSDYSRQRLETLYGKPNSPIAVVPPPVDITPFEAADSTIRRNRNTFTVLTVAHLYPRKNVGAVLEAARQLLNGEAIRFRIIGDGPERIRLERTARSLTNVTLTGHLPRAQLIEEFKHADLFCLPSLQEGFGIVFIEAMAAGLPVVALDSGAAPEIISHGVNGLLVQPRKIHTLARAIQTLHEDVELRTHMREANRRKARNYSIQASTERFLENIL